MKERSILFVNILSEKFREVLQSVIPIYVIVLLIYLLSLISRFLFSYLSQSEHWLS